METHTKATAPKGFQIFMIMAKIHGQMESKKVEKKVAINRAK